MASLTAKVIHGKTYYYARECQRVNGKPRIVRTVYLGWSPMFHWTDSKIRVHAFTCVLALTLSSLLHRSLYQQGVDISLPRMFELLGGIRETLVIYPRKQGQRQPSTARALSTLSAEQEQILTTLNLRRYL